MKSVDVRTSLKSPWSSISRCCPVERKNGWSDCDFSSSRKTGINLIASGRVPATRTILCFKVDFKTREFDWDRYWSEPRAIAKWHSHCDFVNRWALPRAWIRNQSLLLWVLNESLVMDKAAAILQCDCFVQPEFSEQPVHALQVLLDSFGSSVP